MAFIQLRSSVLKVNSILANRTFFTYSKCISQPLERDPAYMEARKAVSMIKSGNKNLLIFFTSLLWFYLKFYDTYLLLLSN